MNCIRKSILLLTLLGGFVQAILAQTQKISGLKAKIAIAKNDAEKTIFLLQLCEERNSLHPDSLLKFAQEANRLARKNNDISKACKANIYIASVLNARSQYDKADSVIIENKATVQANKLEKATLFEFLSLQGRVLLRRGKYKEAIAVFYDGLSKAEAAKDIYFQMRFENSLGLANMEMELHQEALNWFLKALKVAKDSSFLQRYPSLFANTGSTYNNLGKFDSAFYFTEKAILSSQQTEDLISNTNALNIRADIYLNTKQPQKAKKDLEDALVVRRTIGDNFYIVSDMAQLASFYSQVKEFDKGIAMAKEAITIAEQNHLQSKLLFIYNSLAINYKEAGDYKAYSQTLETLNHLQDTIYQKNSAEAIADLQTQYDVQKSENIIVQQKLDLLSKNIWLYALMGAMILLSAIGFFAYHHYRKRQQLKMNSLIAQQQQKETIAVLQAEEKERKRIAADLHDNLGAYAAAISANVKTLKDDERSTAQLTKQIDNNVQDMVNELGNTIWVLKKEKQTLTEISDRLKIWMQRLMINYPTIVYDFAEDINNDQSLSPSHALHLFHMLQEGINNALRHAQCKYVKINIESDKHWQINIIDDGKGFEEERVDKGSGLQNIRDRAAKCSWSVEWQNIYPSGTMLFIGDTNVFNKPKQTN